MKAAILLRFQGVTILLAVWSAIPIFLWAAIIDLFLVQPEDFREYRSRLKLASRWLCARTIEGALNLLGEKVS